MRYFILIITLLLTQNTQSQSSNKNNRLESFNYDEYFHNYNIENFYLHTNKSTYFTDESVFFKAYVVNEVTNKPNLVTTNLHINLYDFNNQLVFSHLFYVEKGKSFGSIKLPKDLKSGKYTLQLNTQWNRNFKKGSNFSIIIQNLSNPVTDFKTTESIDAPITFFAEAGNIIKDVKNTIYFKVKTNNNIDIIGKIVDTKTNKEIAKIYNIDNTYGKCSFVYNSNYTAIFNIDNKEQKIILPVANTRGFVLHKTNARSNDVVTFKLMTNRKTIENKKNKFIHAVLHKKGLKNTIAPFKLSKKVLNYNLNFLKSDLLEGLNTITIFDNDNKILAERPFYYKNEKKVDLSTKIVSQTKDSLDIDLKLINANVNSNISVSVLHKNSQVVDYNSKITKSLINENSNRNLAEGIDIYFQETKTRTSSFYKSIAKQKLIFNSENGLTIKGHLNGKIENPTSHKVTLNSGSVLLTNTLDSNKNFQFENLFLKHPSEYLLILLNEKGKSEESRFYIYNSYVNYKADSILENSIIKTKLKTTDEKTTKKHLTSYSDVSFPIAKDIEKLEGVTLKSVRSEREKRIRQIKKDNPFLAINSGHSRDYLIDSKKDNTTLEQYLRKVSGIRVVNRGSNVFVYNVRRSGLNLNPNLIQIVQDGVPISQESGLINPNQNISDFELISVNLTGLGNGIKAENGVLNLITRREILINNNKYVSKTYETSNGFNQDKEKIIDNNLYFPSKASENAFSAIDWIPDVTLKPNSSNIIKIKKPQKENVKLIINGISDNGDLIYKVIDL